MKVWVVQIGELISGIDNNVRDYRYNSITNYLCKEKHNVIRWGSTFNHNNKVLRSNKHYIKIVNNYLKVILIHSKIIYKKNTSIFRFFQQIDIARKFKKLASSEIKPDIIITGIPVPELSYEVIKYANKYNIYVITDLQDIWPEIYLTLFPKPIRKYIKCLFYFQYKKIKYIFNNSSKINTISNDYKSWINKFLDKKIEVNIYNLGAYKYNNKIEERLKNSIKKKYNIERNPNILFFAGSFGKMYDIECLCKAIIKCNKKANKFIFIIAGDGEKMGIAKSYLKNIKNVYLPGWINYDEVQYLSSISKVGLCTYSSDALQSIPYKPLEYLSHNLFLISSLQGEFKRVVQDNKLGFYYESGNSDKLAECILKYFNSDTNHLLDANKRYYEEHFDSDKIYTRYAKELIK